MFLARRVSRRAVILRKCLEAIIPAILPRTKRKLLFLPSATQYSTLYIPKDENLSEDESDPPPLRKER